MDPEEYMHDARGDSSQEEEDFYSEGYPSDGEDEDDDGDDAGYDFVDNDSDDPSTDMRRLQVRLSIWCTSPGFGRLFA